MYMYCFFFFFFFFFADYTPSGIQQTVTIPASDPDNMACFDGPIIDDFIALEPNETFILNITGISPDNPRIVRGIEVTRITIIDDDGECSCFVFLFFFSKFAQFFCTVII